MEASTRIISPLKAIANRRLPADNPPLVLPPITRYISRSGYPQSSIGITPLPQGWCDPAKLYRQDAPKRAIIGEQIKAFNHPSNGDRPPLPNIPLTTVKFE
ncbi:hypothetical protein AAEJ74_06155 [Limnospira fusiformis PMC 851.14]|uniref:Uncharacterized protein n=1 Tax=Limnospira fusiformis PMC 851.14 TaxID=2219512 RepID=A0ABU9EJB6_LIMFS